MFNKLCKLTDDNTIIIKQNYNLTRSIIVSIVIKSPAIFLCLSEYKSSKDSSFKSIFSSFADFGVLKNTVFLSSF